MATSKPKSTAKAEALTKTKTTLTVKPVPKAKSTSKKPSQKASTKRKPRVTKTKSRRFKPNSFWGLPTELRQLTLFYTYTDRDMEKSICRRWGEARLIFGSHYFDTEYLEDWTLLLMDVGSKVRKETEFVRKKWFKRGWELARAKDNGK
ncbi:hypothetical protein FKW77_006381 [Venturia effusa]|uniref:Uncharacterized protein n=1 Tax=Venturia effusa TaxID=50376 RepID=A0A517LMZ6_9PEZI|nr:hypothetical protein FKW77_006381 [Venturia effusa]